MIETSAADDDKLVAEVYTQALGRLAANLPLAEADRVVYEVEMLCQEVNSGASFEQYFRWATLDELAAVVARLQGLGLDEAADITRRAFDVALPGGLPASAEDMDVLTEWTPEQEERLRSLADEFVECNAAITRVLASFWRHSSVGG